LKKLCLQECAELSRLLGSNVYLRKILIHGARAAVLRIKWDRVPIGAWLDRLDARAHKNAVVVAMANNLARIAWASCPAEMTTGQRPRRPERVRKRRLRLGTLRFPAFPHYDD